MRATKRTVIIRSLWAFIFLLVALSPYAAVTDRTQEAAFVGVFVTPVFLVASEIAGIRALTAASRVTDRGKRRCWSGRSSSSRRRWRRSSCYAAHTSWPRHPIARIQRPLMGVCRTLGCQRTSASGHSPPVASSASLLWRILGLADAARTGAWLWFVGILIVLLGLWTAAGLALVPSGANALKVFTSGDWLPMILAAAPLLTPFIAMLYSLTGRERPKGRLRRACVVRRRLFYLGNSRHAAPVVLTPGRATVGGRRRSASG